MRYPQLDERLACAAELFSACVTGADIGADHGRLSCYLLQTGKCARMIVSDVSAESLQKARALLARHGLDGRADFRVADGLEALTGERPGCAALCGMGGRLISSLLLRGKDALQGADLVLSSHTDIPLVRSTLADIGYHLAAERVLRAKGRFYIVMRAEAGACRYTDKEIYLGPALLRARPPLWREYLLWRRGVVACERGHEQYVRWIEEELQK